MTTCHHCRTEGLGFSRSLADGESLLCPTCHREEIKAILSDADLDREEWARIRRRVEDHLRKSPASLLDVAAGLAATGQIRIDDLI